MMDLIFSVGSELYPATANIKVEAIKTTIRLLLIVDANYSNCSKKTITNSVTN